MGVEVKQSSIKQHLFYSYPLQRKTLFVLFYCHINIDNPTMTSWMDGFAGFLPWAYKDFLLDFTSRRLNVSGHPPSVQ